MMAPSTMGRTSLDTSLSLVWDENLGSGTLTDSTQVRPSRQSSPVSATLSFLACGMSGHHPGQAGAEARDMGAAVALGDVVGEGQSAFVIAVVPGHRDLDRDAFAFRHDHHRLRDQRLLGAV